MNTRIRNMLAVVTMALLSNSLLAHQDHNHGSSQGAHTPGHAESGHDHGHDHTDGHDHHHAEVRIPDNLRDLWGEINVTREKLRLAVEGGQLDRIHGLDEMLSELLKALPEKSTDLGQNERRRVDGQVNNLVQVLGRLHVQADADDLEGTRRQWQVFTRTFPLLARQYPEEISTHREPRRDRGQQQSGARDQGASGQPAPAGARQYAELLTEAACGQCLLGLREKRGCDLAVRIADESYFVDGFRMRQFGNSDAADGMCNIVRQAKVSGAVVDGRFKATSFALLPLEK